MNDKFVIFRYNANSTTPITFLASVYNDEIEATISQFQLNGEISDADLNKKRIAIQPIAKFTALHG